MSKWIVYIDVDDEKLREIAEQRPEDELDIESLIYQEMGWLSESSIHVENIKSISDD